MFDAADTIGAAAEGFRLAALDPSRHALASFYETLMAATKPSARAPALGYDAILPETSSADARLFLRRRESA